MIDVEITEARPGDYAYVSDPRTGQIFAVRLERGCTITNSGNRRKKVEERLIFNTKEAEKYFSADYREHPENYPIKFVRRMTDEEKDVVESLRKTKSFRESFVTRLSERLKECTKTIIDTEFPEVNYSDIVTVTSTGHSDCVSLIIYNGEYDLKIHMLETDLMNILYKDIKK